MGAAVDESIVSVREALRLAVPATAAAILGHLFRPIDQYFVKGLGEEAQGALGSVTFVVILAWSAFLLVSAGAGPLIGRATGAGDAEGVRRVLGSSIFACGLLSVGLAVSGLVLVDPIAGQLGLEGLTATFAADYLRVLFLTGAGLVFAPLITGAFASMGDTTLPLVLQAICVVLNAVANPIFIYTLGMGVSGAALASTLAQTVVVVIGTVVLWRRTGLRLIDIRPNPDLRRVLDVGAPVAVATAAYAIVYVLMLRTSISPLGPAVNAGLGIGFNALEAVTWPLYMGGSTAVASMIGRCLGARREDLAWRAARSLAWPTASLGLGCGLVFWFAGPWLVAQFAANEDVWREGVLYASILAFSQPFVAIEAYTEGVLAGAGDSRRLFWATVPFNLVRVPLAWFLAIHLGFGAAGVWWAINATTFLKAGTKTWMVWRGHWASLQI